MTSTAQSLRPAKVPFAGRDRSNEEAAPTRCQICGADAAPGLDLGHQPVGDLLLTRAELREPETLYPMQMFHCIRCGLTQLGYIVDPAVVYKNFPFVSGTTKTATQHLQSMCTALATTHGLSRQQFAVDIGSNDGTLLKGWLPYGVKFLGVDPSGDPVRIANEQGLTTWHDFFNGETAERIVKEYGKADAVTACGCFAHIDDLDGVMKGVVAVLAPTGIFASDNQYWLDMVERLHYDNAFHQHLRYYSIKPLAYLFDRYGLEIFDVERSDVYGGQIRVFAGFKGAHPVKPAVPALSALEEKKALYERATQLDYAKRIDEKRNKLVDAVHALKKAGKKIIGIGAPAKASTVCTFCRLGPEVIDYVTEVNPLRIGLYLPGVHIPVVDEAFMFEDPKPADAGILFSWNYYEEIVPKLRARGWNGEIILP